MSKFASLSRIMAAICMASALSPLFAVAAPPDFSPNPQVSWATIGQMFKPPAKGAGPVQDDPAHPFITNDDFRLTGKQPTFPVADVSNPILQPWVREVLRKRNENILAGKPGFPPRPSCWPRGVPAFLLEGAFQPVFFVQTEKEILWIAQFDQQIRHIYLDVPHSAHVKPSWFGESIGHFEGDTLVVDTIGLNERTVIDEYLTPHTDKLHVVERIRMTDGGKGLEVNFHVEDPGAFTMPWDAVQRYNRLEPGVGEYNLPISNDGTNARASAGLLLEERCAENPISHLGNEKEAIPLPRAIKPDF
jgi:hypothetical protein